MLRAMFVALVISFANCAIAQSDPLEATRIYGNMYVQGLQVGNPPPVCITNRVYGQSFPKVKGFRDEASPSIIVFLRGFDDSTWSLLKEVDELAASKSLPVYVFVTYDKGFAAGDDPRFVKEKYYSESERETLSAPIAEAAKKHELKAISIGFVVNHLWKKDAGYKSERDVLVAGVRKSIQTLDHVTPGEKSELTAALNHIEQKLSVAK